MSLLVRVPNWLGDLVMSSECLSGLHAVYPDLSFWSHARVSGLLSVFFPGVPVLGLDEKPEGFDKALLLTGSFSSALKAWRARIPFRMGYRGEGRSLLLTSTIGMNRKRDHHHSSDYETLAKKLLHTEPMTTDLSHIAPEGSAHCALFPGANYGSAKRWGRFGELASELAIRTGLPVIFYGTQSEKAMLTEQAGSLAAAEIETGLQYDTLCRRLRSAVISVGNDSGGVHLTALLGIPTVTIFGSTSPLWTAPRGQTTAIVYLDRFCSPCFRQRCPGGEQPPCLEDISLDTVLETCSELMERA